ncbi:IS66 family insertion sequence element accessory protein TnpB [Dysgonomonas reticulitermitis]
MRKSFYTLSGIVTNRMGMDVQRGEAFIFINKSCTSMKILHMECGGPVIYHLRLEEGFFHHGCPWPGYDVWLKPSFHLIPAWTHVYKSREACPVYFGISSVICAQPSCGETRPRSG